MGVLLTDVDDSLELRVLALLDQKPEGLDMKEAGCDQTDVVSELSESLGRAGLMKMSVALERVQFRIILPLGKVHCTGKGTP